MSVTVRRALRSAVVLIVLLGAPPQLVAGRQPSPALTAADADRFERKLNDIARYGLRSGSTQFRADRARRTIVTEAETNAYIRLRISSELPKGMVSPYISAMGGGRVSATAVIDLDSARKGTEHGSLDPSQLLSGKLPVKLAGVLRTRNGVATFEFESASIAGIPVPKVVLQQLVTHYSRSAEHPDGINMDSQFLLPSGIREIDIQLRQAVVVQ